MKEVNNLIDTAFYRFKKLHRERPVPLTTHKFIRPLNLTNEHIEFLDVLQESLKNNINKAFGDKLKELSK